jgi:hypothetical protein
MKLSARMKKILLFLLHAEKSFEWFRRSGIGIVEEKEGYFDPDAIMCFLENKRFSDFSRSEVISYGRTFKILEKLGLVKLGYSIHGLALTDARAHDYKLTVAGRTIAEKVEKEIRDFIREYENLV